MRVGDTHRDSRSGNGIGFEVRCNGVAATDNMAKKLLDGVAILSMCVRHNRDDIDLRKLRRLADKVYPRRRRRRFMKMIEDIDAGRTIHIVNTSSTSGVIRMVSATVNGQQTGHIVQVIGSTFDAEFDEGHLPEIYNALTDRRRIQGRHDPPDRRGAAAPRRQPRPLRRPRLDRRPGARHEGRSTPARPCQVPVGKETLGRVFNLLGEPIDGRGPVNAKEHRLDPPPSRRSSPTCPPRPNCSRPASRSSTC